MDIMHKMVEKELKKLHLNLDRFLRNSENVKQVLRGRLSGCGLSAEGGGGGKNMFAYVAFDRYMAQLTTVLNMARKFNINFQLNELPETVMNDLEAVGGSCLPSRLFQDFIQWSMLGREGGIEGPSNDYQQLFTNYHDLDVNTTERKAIESSPERVIQSEDEGSEKGQCKKTARKNYFKASTVDEYLQTILPTKSLSHLKNGHTFSAFITHVKDTKKLLFYVCEMNDYDTLFEICCSADFKQIQSVNRDLDKIFCVAQHKMGTENGRKCFWRAVLVPEEIGQDSDLALLIDIGEIIHITKENELYALSPRFAKLPPMGIQCILKGLSDADGRLVTDHLKCKDSLIAKQFKMAKFRVLSQESGLLNVILLDTSENELRQLPSSTCPSPTRYSRKSNPFLDSMLLEDDFDSDGNSDPMPLPISSVYGNMVQTHLRSNHDESGENLVVTVTYISSPVNFYGVIENAESEMNDAFFWNDMQISHLQKILSEPLQLNDIVLARYAKDDHWYRAKIIDMLDANLYKVFYIDFGNIEVVSLTSIATCNPQQKKPPSQAVRFRIAGVKLVYTGSNENKRLQQATETIVVMLLNQTVNLRVVGRSSRSGSEEVIVNFNDAQYSNITTMLLDMGVVKEV